MRKTESLHTAQTGSLATEENTIFVTICDYPKPERMSELIMKTAQRFDVPLQFASYGQSFTCLYEKLPKMLGFLKQQSNSVKYVFFVDCRDTVFAKPFGEILDAFNNVYTGGILVQSGTSSLLRKYISDALAAQIVKRYGVNGFACSGCYCGEITEVIKVLERAVQLYDNIGKRFYDDPIASLYLNDPNSKSSVSRLKDHDEFLFQLLQLEEHSLINPDVNKTVSALFANDRPNQGHVSLASRRKAPVGSILGVGNAGILHSPLLSRNAMRWQQWVEKNILDCKGIPIVGRNLPKSGRHNTTIVARIRNRNAIFADTLQNWLQFNVPIIIVDWRDDGCESAYEIVKGLDNVTYIATKYEYMFYQTAAWNLGISRVKTEYVLNVDVDDVLREDFFEVNSIDGSEFSHFAPVGNSTYLYGLSLVSKSAFDAVNGYSENMLYKQHGDCEFYNRLEKAGYTRKYMVDGSAMHKPHDDELRVCNTLQDSKLVGQKQGRIFVEKCREFNISLGNLLPWSPRSSRIQWNLTEIEKNSYLAVRDVDIPQMEATADNTLFATVAAWSDWEEKTKIIRGSAQKQGIDLHIVEPGIVFQNFYTNKFKELYNYLLNADDKYKYFVFLDARDALFVKDVNAITKNMCDFRDDIVYFNVGKITFPIADIWFADRIQQRYGNAGIINSGVYFGRIDRVLKVYEECAALCRYFTSEEVRSGSFEEVIKQIFNKERTDLEITVFSGEYVNEKYLLGKNPDINVQRCLSSDQFYIQLLQAMWRDDLIRPDIDRKVCACFDGGWPDIKNWHSNGEMPLGTAGILHSPWMFPRDCANYTAEKNGAAWEQWVSEQSLID